MAYFYRDIESFGCIPESFLGNWVIIKGLRKALYHAVEELVNPF
jgi:hypothetical protein